MEATISSRISAVAMRKLIKKRNLRQPNAVKAKSRNTEPLNGHSQTPAKKKRKSLKGYAVPPQDIESDLKESDENESSNEDTPAPKPFRRRSQKTFNEPKNSDSSLDDENELKPAASKTQRSSARKVAKKNVSARSLQKTIKNSVDKTALRSIVDNEEASSEEKDESEEVSAESDTFASEEDILESQNSEDGEDIEENSQSKPNQTNLASYINPPIHVACGNEAAEESFRWLIFPTAPNVFFSNILDKKHMYIKRSNSKYYEGLFSSKEFDKIMRENDLNYERQIDVLSYVDGKRTPVINDMKVYAGFVWNAYGEGNSVRMRNPQTYHKGLWKICSLLQEYFSSSVGVNMYLTPPGSQGFPPHYDDIDAFILQIEGIKKWKVYKPRTENEVLPRYSSGDMTEDELDTPCLQVALAPGDLLYIPRGFIHQARAPKNSHSLHLTFSVNQMNTWGDFLQAGLSHALEKAIESNAAFRESLPKDYVDFVGSAYADNESKQRGWFGRKALTLAKKALEYFSIDQAADAHAVNFIHSSLPPVFNKIESSCSIHGNGTHLENGRAMLAPKLTSSSKVRFIRKRAFRLVVDGDGAQLFYTLANSKDSKEKEALFLEVDLSVVPGISFLFKSHPSFVEIDNLPLEDTESKLELAQQLYDSGFLMVEPTLE